MKRYLKLITILLAISMLLLLGTTGVKAATSNLTTNAKNNTATAGDTIKVTVTVNAAQWNLTLLANGKSLNTWTETVNYKENLSKTFTASYKTSKAETVNFVLQGDITDVNQTNTEINTSKSVTVKAKTTTSDNNGGSTGSSGSTSSGSNTTTAPKTPTFKTASKTMYTTGDVNLRASWSTSSAATTVEKGTELKVTGTSSETINGYVWYRVNYKGATKYVASSLLTATKPKDEEKDDEKDNEKSSNKNLSSLSIEGIELTPKFNKDTTQYTAKVDGDVTELKIDYKVEDSKAKVSVEGNKELKEGDNIIKVKVTAEDDTARTYFITVTKGEETQINTNLTLSELKIARVNFEDTFKPDTYTYELSLNTYVDKLDITAVPNQADAKVEITGNNEFKAGKNMVTILLTSADGTKTATYQIEVNLPEEVVAQTSNNSDMIMYIGIGVAIAIVIIIIFLLIFRRKGETKEPDNEEEIQETVEEPKVTVNEFFENAEEQKSTSKKSKGRHSI